MFNFNCIVLLLLVCPAVFVTGVEFPLDEEHASVLVCKDLSPTETTAYGIQMRLEFNTVDNNCADVSATFSFANPEVPGDVCLFNFYYNFTDKYGFLQIDKEHTLVNISFASVAAMLNLKAVLTESNEMRTVTTVGARKEEFPRAGKDPCWEGTPKKGQLCYQLAYETSSDECGLVLSTPDANTTRLATPTPGIGPLPTTTTAEPNWWELWWLWTIVGGVIFLITIIVVIVVVLVCRWHRKKKAAAAAELDVESTQKDPNDDDELKPEGVDSDGVVGEQSAATHQTDGPESMQGGAADKTVAAEIPAKKDAAVPDGNGNTTPPTKSSDAPNTTTNSDKGSISLSPVQPAHRSVYMAAKTQEEDE